MRYGHILKSVHVKHMKKKVRLGFQLNRLIVDFKDHIHQLIRINCPIDYVFLMYDCTSKHIHIQKKRENMKNASGIRLIY